MLSTGIRTPVGIKISGADLGDHRADRPGDRGASCRRCPARAASSPSAWPAATSSTSCSKRDQLARYGLSVDDANMMVMTAVGGDNQSTTVEGRERYGVNVRYARDYREDLAALQAGAPAAAERPGPDPHGGDRRRASSSQGPSMIRDENGLLAGYVYVDFDTSKIDVGSYVEQAKKAVGSRASSCPTGYSPDLERPVREHAAREGAAEAHPAHHAGADLRAALHEHQVGLQGRRSSCWPCPSRPSARSGSSGCSATTSPSPSGSGMIALMGLDAETGVFMLLFLDLSHDEAKAQRAAAHHAATSSRPSSTAR